MRRADRLFQIVQYLRGGRLATAAQLADKLEVSERTIYRDIVDLQSTGVPIDGEAGVGYVMRSGFDLPPLMFTRSEILSLVAGARIVRAWGGASMARAAEEALIKIETVLPEGMRDQLRDAKIFALAPPSEMTDTVREALDFAERAIDGREVIAFGYCDDAGAATQRSVQPLGLWFWGRVWTLVAWCELRDDYRMFRLDRMADIILADRKFVPSPQRSLAEYLRRMEAQHGSQS